MHKSLLLRTALVVGLLGVLTLPSRADPITEIVEAGILGCNDTPGDFGPPFWKDVDKACRDKSSCQVRLTDSYPLATLQQYGCSGFFVNFICKGTNEEVNSSDVSASINLKCE